MPFQSQISFPEPLLLAEEALALISHAARQAEIDVVLEIPEGLSQIRGDRARLEQVLVNLMKNGIDAMLAEARPDALMVVTTDSTHAEYVVKGARAGLSVSAVE